MCVCTRIRETVLLSSATSKTPNDSSEVQHRKLLTTHLKIQHSYMHLRARVHENKKDGVTLECNIANFKRLISIFTNSWWVSMRVLENEWDNITAQCNITNSRRVIYISRESSECHEPPRHRVAIEQLVSSCGFQLSTSQESQLNVTNHLDIEWPL